MDGSRLICFIACVVIIHVCQVIAADLDHMNIKLNRLNRKHDALQQEVDELWATIIRSGSQKLGNGNQTQTGDARSTQELFTKANKKLSEMEDLKKEIKNLVLYSRTGLKNEKAWQRKAMMSMTSEWEDLKTSVETENENLRKTFRDTEDKRNDKRLSKMETENRKLRNIIAEVQNDYKKIQENNEQELSNVQAENRELRNILAVVKQDYEKVQENMEAQIGSLSDTINELRDQELSVCDEGWEEFNGHCYLHRSGGTWDDAAAKCESMGSYLVEITSDAEMKFINDFTRNKAVHYGKWIGATDRDDQGTYIFQHSKVTVPEKFWRNGEPNNIAHHCVAMYDFTDNGTGIIEFYDWSCSAQYNAVCENSGSLKDAMNDLQNDAYKMKRDFTKCDEGWEGFNGHCYLHHIETTGLSWDDAAAFCESKNSYLVEITTDDEMKFINDFMRNKEVQYGKWVGATDRDDQGNYVYHHSKLPVPEKFWGPRQPSHDDEHCVDMWDSTRNGTGIIEFFDEPCSKKYIAVCEKPS